MRFLTSRPRPNSITDSSNSATSARVITYAKIVALSDIYSQEAVARALADALEYGALPPTTLPIS